MEDLGQASQIWSMLDDMAENNPSAYRKFIDKQLKEGREYNMPPKPHMCVQTCLTSNWTPVYINLCSWGRITKPKDDSSPIPVFGSKLLEQNSEEDGDYFTVHAAFHPDVLDQLGENCTNKDEQKALIQLAIAYVEDQNKIKLAANYYITDFEFKGDVENIREDFGLARDPMKKEFEKLAKTFAPVADIATKDPELVNQMTSGDNISVTREETVSDIKIPGLTPTKQPEAKLIEEIKLTPKYSLSYKSSSADGSDKCIVVRIELEKVGNVQECTLDITQKTLQLASNDYFLQLDLPEQVMEDKVKARFSKTRHQLTVTMPTAS